MFQVFWFILSLFWGVVCESLGVFDGIFVCCMDRIWPFFLGGETCQATSQPNDVLLDL